MDPHATPHLLGRHILAPIGLVSAAIALRIWSSGSFELAEDEAYYWVWSRRLAGGYFDHPPAIAWLIRGGTELLGDTERGVRLLTSLLGGITALLVAGLGAPHQRLTIVAALASIPLMALGGILATPDVPLVCAWALGLLAAHHGRWKLVGVAAGLAMLSKYTGVLLLPLLVLGQRGSWRRPGPWWAALIATAVYFPNIWWNLGHDLASWRFQLDHVQAGSARLDFLAAQVGLVGPVLFSVLVAWWAVGWRGDTVERLCWWASFPVLLIAVLSGGEANWAAPAYLGAIAGVAQRSGRWARATHVGIGLSLVLSIIGLVHFYQPLIDLPVDPRERLVGGRVLADSVEAWGIEQVYTSRYQEAALIHFYSGIPAHALPDLGREDQYDLWPVGWAEHALFVRVWSGGRRTPVEERGYTRSGPNVVTAYLDTTQPLVDRPVARWQVYELRREDSP